VPETSGDQFGSLLESAKLAPGKAMQVSDGVGQSIFHSALDAGIARLLGIEFGGVGRQVGHREVARVRVEEGGCLARPMRVESVPNHEKWRTDLPTEVPEAFGAFPDFPEVSALRSGYGKDVHREPIE